MTTATPGHRPDAPDERETAQRPAPSQQGEHADLDADEGADAFETAETAAPTVREDSPERQEEALITLDTPD